MTKDHKSSHTPNGIHKNAKHSSNIKKIKIKAREYCECSRFDQFQCNYIAIHTWGVSIGIGKYDNKKLTQIFKVPPFTHGIVQHIYTN